MDVLHCHLECIERSCFRYLHFFDELRSQILNHNSIWSGKECQYMFNKMLLILCQCQPIGGIFTQVNFSSNPKRRKMLFIHIPKSRILDRERGVTKRFGRQDDFGHGEKKKNKYRRMSPYTQFNISTFFHPPTVCIVFLSNVGQRLRRIRWRKTIP